MSQLLNLARAARLVGATRGALQLKIREGELPSFDGMVSAEDLLRLYPDAKFEVDGAFEHVTQIKEKAFGKRVRERTLPSQELLAERLFEQSRELADVRLHLQRYHELVMRLGEQIRRAHDASQAPWRDTLASLAHFLDHELEAVLGATDAPNALSVMDDMLRVMSSHVVLRPSGHEYFVEGADTLLEGALKAGLALNYGCSNGICGLCKCRLVSGQVKRIRPHDYVLTEAEKQAGHTLACSYAPVTDVVVEALEAGGPDDIPSQQISARVKSIEPLADDVLLLHLQTPRTNRLRFLAGQRVSLSFHPAGSAELPVASCPCDDRNLQFHLRRDPDSSFAAHVFAGMLRPGDSVNVFGPWGEFVLRDETARRLVFAAFDQGFAPVKSVIEHAMALENAESIHLYWHASRPGGHYLANLCRAWADALDDFRYVPLGGERVAAPEEASAELAALIARDFPRGENIDVYLAGPAAAVETLGERLRAAGVAPERLVTTAV